MRDRYVLVFAASIFEANAYAKRAKLFRGAYRAVGSAASIRNIQVADVHVLPGFYNRRDKHALDAEIRHGRDIRRFDVEMPSPAETPAIDQGDGMGQQLAIDLQTEPDLEPRRAELEKAAPEPSPELDLEPKRARRSRCKDCGELTLEDHDHSAPPAPGASTVAQQRAAIFGGGF